MTHNCAISRECEQGTVIVVNGSEGSHSKKVEIICMTNVDLFSQTFTYLKQTYFRGNIIACAELVESGFCLKLMDDILNFQKFQVS